MIGKDILGSSVLVECAIASGDSEVNDAHDTLPLGMPSSDKIAQIIHKKFLTSGYAIGCVHPEDDLSKVNLYFIPHWEIFKPEWADKLEKYVSDGGVLVIGARTATKDFNNNVIAETPPGVLAKLAGINVVEYGKQNPGDGKPFDIVFASGKKVSSSLWYEELEHIDTKTRAVAKWADGHLKGSTAISAKKHGKGSVFYVGSYFSDDLLSLLLPELLKASRLKPIISGIPDGVEVSVRKHNGKKIFFLVNGKNRSSGFFEAPRGTVILDTSGIKNKKGKISLPPFGVRIIVNVNIS